MVLWNEYSKSSSCFGFGGTVPKVRGWRWPEAIALESILWSGMLKLQTQWVSWSWLNSKEWLWQTRIAADDLDPGEILAAHDSKDKGLDVYDASLWSKEAMLALLRALVVVGCEIAPHFFEDWFLNDRDGNACILRSRQVPNILDQSNGILLWDKMAILISPF